MTVTQRRNRLRRRIPFAGHVALRHGDLRDRPHRLAGLTIQHEQQALFGRLRQRFDGPAILDGVDENRRRRNVVIPQRMMRRLEVPTPFARADVDRDDALAVQIRTGPKAAVHVAVRRFDGQIRQPKLLVGRDRGPDAGVAAARPRGVVEPAFVAALAGLRHGVESPQQLAGHDIETADVADDVVGLVGRRERRMRRGHHDDVARDRRRRVGPDLAPVPIVALIERRFEIDDAVVTEGLDGTTCRGVQRDELIARRHIDDALVVTALPKREPAARELTRCFGAARTLIEAIDPELLAGRSIQRRDGAACTARRVEHAVDDDRRTLESILRGRAQVRDAVAPRNLERAEVAGVDLLERRIARVTQIAAVGGPFAVARSVGRLRDREVDRED